MIIIIYYIHSKYLAQSTIVSNIYLINYHIVANYQQSLEYFQHVSEQLPPGNQAAPPYSFCTTAICVCVCKGVHVMGKKMSINVYYTLTIWQKISSLTCYAILVENQTYQISLRMGQIAETGACNMELSGTSLTVPYCTLIGSC